MMKRRKGFYSISIVAKMFSVHQQTVRLYEKEGLICPKRTQGNTRIFSEDDIDRLEQVIHLTHKMGVNIAGVQMILKLQKKMKSMQDEINKTFKQMHGHLEKEGDKYQQDIKDDGETLVKLKQDCHDIDNKKIEPIDVREASKGSLHQQETNVTDESETEENIVDDWEVEYDSD